MMEFFEGQSTGMDGPAAVHFVITPSDVVDLSPRPRAMIATVGGDVTIRDNKGTDIKYTLQSGQILPFAAVRVMATGTTATVVGWR